MFPTTFKCISRGYIFGFYEIQLPFTHLSDTTENHQLDLKKTYKLTEREKIN